MGSFSANRTKAVSAMRATWTSWRWTLLVVAMVFLTISAGILHPDVWKVFGVGYMHPAFVDMQALLAAGEAWRAGYDPYVGPNLFDSYDRPHIYGPAWLVTGAAGFTVAHVAEFSVLTLLGFFGSLAYWYRPQGWKTAAGVLAVLLSAPILLGLERANNDLIVVMLFSLAAVISGRKGLLPSLAVVLLLAMCAWLKLYPAIAGIALFTLPGGIRASLGRVAIWGLLTLVGFALYAVDYLLLMRNIPDAQTIFAYDIRYAFTISIGGVPTLRIWTWAGTLLACVLAVTFLWRHRRDYWNTLPLTGPWAFFTVSAATIWVGCLLTNPSYPYRAVWLLPLLAWGASPKLGNPAAGRALCQWIIGFFGLWWVQWQSYVILIENNKEDFSPYLAGVLGATHATVILTTVFVAWLLLGWGWRRGCAFFTDSKAVPDSPAA
jgi:hypothetical protein